MSMSLPKLMLANMLRSFLLLALWIADEENKHAERGSMFGAGEKWDRLNEKVRLDGGLAYPMEMIMAYVLLRSRAGRAVYVWLFGREIVIIRSVTCDFALTSSMLEIRDQFFAHL